MIFFAIPVRHDYERFVEMNIALRNATCGMPQETCNSELREAQFGRQASEGVALQQAGGKQKAGKLRAANCT